jgi:sugar phosphate isomerase/epimerase
VQDPELTLANARRATGQVTLAATLGAGHLRLLAPPYGGGLLSRERRRSAAGVDALVELAAPLGLAVLVETAPATLAPSPELAATLVERHPPTRAGVLYDPGNMAIEGSLMPQLSVARLGRHLRHVHVKNISWSRHAGCWRWQHDSLRAGILDWAVILAQLATARYGGMFSIDHLGGDASPTRLCSERNVLCALLEDAWEELADGGRGRSRGLPQNDSAGPAAWRAATGQDA